MKTSTAPHPSTLPAIGLSSGPACDWHFETGWADSEAQVEAAQALRFQVFAGELGARLSGRAMACERDIDRFDDFCDHLLVWACDGTGTQPRTLVGTYRVLPPAAARRAGGLYAEQEFDLGPLASLRPRMIELGRACVAPAWRSGGVILALWAALGKYMVRHRLETMVGCASVGLLDGGGFAHALWHTLRETHLVAPEWRLRPRTALPPPGAAGSGPTVPVPLRAMPPLIKGYLRGGARVLGAPAYDAAFHTADLPIMMRMQELSPRYRAQFLLP
jgi:putative hemolysin